MAGGIIGGFGRRAIRGWGAFGDGWGGVVAVIVGKSKAGGYGVGVHARGSSVLDCFVPTAGTEGGMRDVLWAWERVRAAIGLHGVSPVVSSHLASAFGGCFLSAIFVRFLVFDLVGLPRTVGGFGCCAIGRGALGVG